MFKVFILQHFFLKIMKGKFLKLHWRVMKFHFLKILQEGDFLWNRDWIHF